MGVQDAFEIFCTDLDVTEVITTEVDSTNSIDLGARLDAFGDAVSPDIGWGKPIYIEIAVTTAFTGSGTLLCDLYDDTATAFGSEAFMARLGTISALAADGDKIYGAVPPETVDRYVKMKFTVASGDIDTGTVSAALCPQPESPAAK